MNKKDLIRKMADGAKISVAQSEVAIDSLIASIIDAVNTHGFVNITGLGSFTSSVTKPRFGQNPKTQEKIFIPPQYSVKFKPSKAFKEGVNPTAIRMSADEMIEHDLSDDVVAYMINNGLIEKDNAERDVTA